jgi:stalled ribosome rescue protein Dom34
MSTYHAVVWLDHRQAHVLMFDREHVEAERVKARSHHPAGRGLDRATTNAYFGAVADALAGVHEVLLVGPALAKDEFEGWCRAYRPQVARAIVGKQAADHPSDGQLVALARKYFLRYDQQAADPSLA